MGATQYPVFTIGHSNHSWEAFVKLLLRHRIEEVADVRSAPYSRYVAHFNHSEFQQALEDIGVGYASIQPEHQGATDLVTPQTALTLRDSLRLIRVNDLTLSVSAPRSTQGEFQYAGTSYRLRVADPNYHRSRFQQHDNDIQIGPCFLTISLGEPFQGHSYKLIAAIIR